jgi:hypothetical protein
VVSSGRSCIGTKGSSVSGSESRTDSQLNHMGEHTFPEFGVQRRDHRIWHGCCLGLLLISGDPGSKAWTSLPLR